MLIDPDLHLFLDDSEVDARDGVIRHVHTLRRERVDPVLVADRTWEGPQIAYGCVLKDPLDGQYRLWYNTHRGATFPFLNSVCLALSEDGVHWEKPALTRSFSGDGIDTNVVLEIDEGHFCDSLIVLPRRNPGESTTGLMALQFRHFGTWAKSADRPPGVYALSSADGVQWSLWEPAVLPLQGDRTSVAWDPRKGVYLLTTRHAGNMLLGRNNIKGQRRDLDLWQSEDLVSWQHYGRILAPDDLDPPDTHFYSGLPVPYGAGYLAFLEVYHKDHERLDMQLAWSSDAYHWTRVAGRQPIFTTGGEGSWDSHRVCVTANPPEQVGDRLRFWYTGGENPHGSGGQGQRSVGVATIRKDGFVSMDGSDAGGMLTTVLLSASEPRGLTVNIDAKTGRYSVAVLDQDGIPLPGFTHEDCRVSSSNSVQSAVSWSGGAVIPVSLEGVVRLQFFLRRASLFSYRWTNPEGQRS